MALYSSPSDFLRRFHQVSVAVTGLAWPGAGVLSLQQGTASIDQPARYEIMLSAYSITRGAGSLIDHIAELAVQGVVVT